MAGNITYIGNKNFRLRVSTGSGADRKIFSKNVRYNGRVDEDKIQNGEFPESIKNELAKYYTDVTGGKVAVQRNITLNEFVKLFKRDYSKDLAIKTQSRYDALLERILPALGHMKMQNIGPTHLNKFYNNLGEIGMKMPKIKDIAKRLETLQEMINKDPESTRLSDTTIHRHHELLSSMFTKAVQWGFMTNNPAERADPPSIVKSKKKYIQDDKIPDVMDALTREPLKYQAAILLDIFSGLRRGELVGLEWPDFNWTKNTVTVQRQSQYQAGIGIFQKDDLKTDSSNRSIRLPAFVIRLLRRYKEAQEAEKEAKRNKGKLEEDSQRLFIQRNGEPMHPDTLTQWFPEFLRRHGFEHVNLHGLRHTFASIVNSLGFDPITGATLLGHAEKDTYMKIYAHMFDSAPEAVANKIDKRYGPKESPPKEYKIKRYVLKRSV